MHKKRATSFDVAREAGVSRTTVSFVLNDVQGESISAATRARVLEAARKLNYHPDATGRKLVSGRSYTIGFVLRQSVDQVISDALLPQVILGIENAASHYHFQVLLKPIDPQDGSGYLHLIRENHTDGILLSGPRQDDEEILRLHRDGTPIVLMGQLPGSDIPCVDIDAIEGARKAAAHLIDTGRRTIGLITNAPLAYTSAEQRRLGYSNALAEAGIDYSPRLVVEGGFTPSSGYSAMQGLLRGKEKVDAVFVASDVVASGAVLAIREAGLKIPDDIAVVGFDDIPIVAFFDPPLSSVKTPAYQLGWSASEQLIRMIRDEPLLDDKIIYEPELVVRASSGA